MESPILFVVENGIAVITLNRPERRNAFNQALLAAIYDAVDEVARNPEIKVAVITGAGKAFCSGIDLKAIGTDNLFDPCGDGRDMPDVMGGCPKPIIGAVNGHAITGGFELALNCDFLIASELAQFADTHARVGIHPGWGMTQLLQQAVGVRMARQMSFTCQFIDANTALRAGLVNEVVPPDRLLPRAMEIAAQICEANPEMLRTIKNLIEHRNKTVHDEAFTHERAEFRAFVAKVFSK